MVGTSSIVTAEDLGPNTKDNVVEPSTWANFPTGKRIEVSSSAGANYIVQPGALAAGYTE